jgi:succinate dehydrogenase / fumarate reductase membrane anchor subunit
MLAMVNTATSLGRSGAQDWLIQRVSAVILAGYTLFIMAYLIFHSEHNYENWRVLFRSDWMRYSSLLALLSLIAHAWIGVWTVITDYIKPVMIRIALQLMVFLALLAYLVLGMKIIWE